MTYDARELSDEDGAPVMVAVFTLDGKVWRFVRGDQSLEIGGEIYQAVPGGIEATSQRETTETAKNDVKLVVDRAFPIAELWRKSPPTSLCLVFLRELHQGDGEVINTWMGHVSNVGWVGEARAEITLSPGALAMKTNGLRRKYQRGCPHVLYGPKCRLPREDHETDAELTHVDGVAISAESLAESEMKFAGGWLEWTDQEGIIDRRFITHHDGAGLRMMTPAPGLAVGMVFTFVEGCDRTPSRCVELGNMPRYGGFPYFISKNPFGNNPLY